MSKPWLPFCRLLTLIAALASSGCDRLFDSSRQNIDAAEKKAAAGQFKEAIRLYEASLDGTTKTAEVHYRMALIYADKLKRPGDAIHHFHRYLEMAPSGPHAKEAQEYDKEGDRLVLGELAGGSPPTQNEAVRLKNENLSMRNLLNSLRAQKNQPVASPSPGGKKGEEPQKPIPTGARKHVVQPGETLASIATKYYKNKARYHDIEDANFYSVNGTPKLKPGMVLAIP